MKGLVAVFQQLRGPPLRLIRLEALLLDGMPIGRQG
jgi:hypothetical protein